MEITEDKLFQKIKILNETTWESRVSDGPINEWLKNFTRDDAVEEKERLHALFLLSNMIYFGSREMRELMKSLYRDLYQYPIIESIRKNNSDSTDRNLIMRKFEEELQQTLFVGLGGPSESGCHLLYLLRQENSLHDSQIILADQIFDRNLETGSISIRFPDIRRYVFIDDFSGSGDQGTRYSRKIVSKLKRLDPDVHAAYYMTFATSDGIDNVRSNTKYDDVQCVYELDSTFKCFSNESRYFSGSTSPISQSFAQAMCLEYGSMLCSDNPLGYGDCQLLIAFHHNTPNNTLPIIWHNEPNGISWTPIFRRYNK